MVNAPSEPDKPLRNRVCCSAPRTGGGREQSGVAHEKPANYSDLNAFAQGFPSLCLKADDSLGSLPRNGHSMANHKIEIRRRNTEKILLAAEKIFSEKGYGGASMGDIAEEVGLPRSNLHYYFSTKDDLYRAVLLDLLEVWKQDALCFEMFDDPRVVLSSYIRAKMTHSRTRPHGSKVWANEIIHGAPMLGDELDKSLYDWAKMKEAKIRQWVEDKRILAVEPSSLLYMIWASTQHYADFSHQVKVLNDHQALSEMQFEKAVQTITTVILRGIGLEP
tara:strand:- start:419 stop:1249 length:831 start_codon:yes stop_codon:yes gene_type:complete